MDFTLLCLGRPTLIIDGMTVKLEMRKSLALLVYLRMIGRDCAREFLQALFWPEYDQKRAQANLRRALSSLNKSLSSPLIETNRDKAGFIEPKKIALDVDHFHALLGALKNHRHRQGQLCPECLCSLEEAEQLYKGDFMEGFNLEDCPEFDEWQLNQREELKRELAEVLESLSQAYAARGEWEKAIRAARRWVSLDRLDEAAQRQLILVYAQAGQLSAAQRQFEELAHHLDEELGQSPAPESVALLEQIRARAREARLAVQQDPGPPSQENAGRPLIRTKLFAPSPRPNRVSRPRLLAQLEPASQYALLLICAPAGYGKTTLLLEWIQAYKAGAAGLKRAHRPFDAGSPKFAWLSLDSGDNDPRSFLAYLLAALENAQPGITADSQLLLQSPQPLPLPTILGVLINRLHEMAAPLWLVLDDYQAIEAPAIHESVTFLLEHRPAQFHLVIASRSNLPLPLHRLRARNQLLEVRGGDLRFTAEEAAAFLNQVMDLSLSSEDVNALEFRTEGWIAGLQMAALSLQGRQDRSSFVRDFGGSHRYILEYLIEEILSRQSETIQAFLLQTSILDRLCNPLCDAILENAATSQVRLDELERSNLFLTPLDEVGYWYRYHHLFADLLRARLSQSQPRLVPMLHLRASLWYEKEGLPVETIRHALAAGELERAANLLERFTMQFMERGEMSSLLNFVHELPEEIVACHPGLCLQHAWVLTFSGQIGQVEPRLKQAEAHLEPGDLSPRAQGIQGSAASIRALVADFSGDMAAAIQLARKADALLPEENSLAHGVINYVLGDGYVAIGELEKAETAYEKICQFAQSSANLWVNEEALFKLSVVKKLQGRLHAARVLYQEAIDLAAEKNALQAGSMGAAFIGLSDLQREWNQLEEAQGTASLAIHSMEHWPSAIDLVNGYVSLARTAIARGEVASAEEALNKAGEFSHKGRLFQDTWKRLDAARLRLWLAKGDLPAVKQWADSQPLDEITAALSEKPDYIAELAGITLGRAFIASGGDVIGKAINLLDRIAVVSRGAGQAGLLIEALALLALAHRSNGDLAAAQGALRDCLELAQPEGYLRLFLDEGQAMQGMLAGYRALIENSMQPGDQRLRRYLDQMLAAFLPCQEPRPGFAPPQTALIEPLTARELEVLGLICEGYSNQEIAEKLVVSMNTVKKHNNRIFGKLGATSRVQAVLLARKSGLVKEASPSNEG